MVRSGFSLVEVIVAMTLLSVGMLAVAASGIIAAQLQREAELHEVVTQHATSLVDSIATRRVHGSGTVNTSRYRLEWRADSTAIHVHAHVREESYLVLETVR